MENKFPNIRVEKLQAKKELLEQQLCDPAVIADQTKYKQLTQDHAFFKNLSESFIEYSKALDTYEDNRAMLSEGGDDDEFLQLVEADQKELEGKTVKLEQEIKVMLLPKDENAGKNVMLEIRAGTGGDEAALFAADLLRMYTRYCETNGWKMEQMSLTDTGIGGIKEIVVCISGADAYMKLKNESGTHRVQRVPETEAAGRIHTSAVTVAVLPEAQDIDVQIDPNDIKVDVYRSSGNGGQSVNTTDSAVRITHLETGLVVTCQDEKSQLKNKNKALRILRARLQDKLAKEQSDAIAGNRKNMIGSGDRSEKIRTYNFPQSRVTDHRIGLTLYSLNEILNGEVDALINPLLEEEYNKSMEQSNSALDLG